MSALGAVESEKLARGYPRFLANEWLLQLAAVVALQKKVGRDSSCCHRNAAGLDRRSHPSRRARDRLDAIIAGSTAA